MFFFFFFFFVSVGFSFLWVWLFFCYKLYMPLLPMPQYQDYGPMFTMAPRAADDTDKMKVPGPGTYDCGDLDICREKLPAFTMAPKTELPSDKTPKPAPNAYSPEKVSNYRHSVENIIVKLVHCTCIMKGFCSVTLPTKSFIWLPYHLEIRSFV